jgi:hypothetical protein
VTTILQTNQSLAPKNLINAFGHTTHMETAEAMTLALIGQARLGEVVTGTLIHSTKVVLNIIDS